MQTFYKLAKRTFLQASPLRGGSAINEGGAGGGDKRPCDCLDRCCRDAASVSRVTVLTDAARRCCQELLTDAARSS